MAQTRKERRSCGGTPRLATRDEVLFKWDKPNLTVATPTKSQHKQSLRYSHSRSRAKGRGNGLDASMSSSDSESDTSSGFDERRVRRASRTSRSDSGSDSSDRLNCDSSDDDDDVSLRLVGDAHLQRKFRWLRRIFLSQPKASRSLASRRSERPSKAPWRRSGFESTSDSDEEREAKNLRRGDRSERSAGDNQRSNRQERERSQQTLKCSSVPVGSLQEEIDQQIRALCEQVELLSAQRDSSAKQRETSLQRAIEELQLVKSRQCQALETQTRVIEESYAMRLEVLERQYQAKIAEIRREMCAAIQKQREECENAVLSAVKQLQQQTQADLLGEIGPREIDERIDALATRSSACKRSDRDAWTFREDVRCSTPRPSPVSPMTRQRAKLQVFEQKLRTLPQASVHRVTSQVQQQNAAALKRGSFSVRPVGALGSGSDPDQTDRHRWQPAPLSPLRSSPSRWKRGISRECTRVCDGDDRSNGLIEEGSGGNESELSWKSHTRRYLRPEEERELLRLRNSIGLAKDWIENNVQES